MFGTMLNIYWRAILARYEVAFVVVLQWVLPMRNSWCFGAKNLIHRYHLCKRIIKLKLFSLDTSIDLFACLWTNLHLLGATYMGYIGLFLGQLTWDILVYSWGNLHKKNWFVLGATYMYMGNIGTFLGQPTWEILVPSWGNLHGKYWYILGATYMGNIGTFLWQLTWEILVPSRGNLHGEYWYILGTTYMGNIGTFLGQLTWGIMVHSWGNLHGVY